MPACPCTRCLFPKNGVLEVVKDRLEANHKVGAWSAGNAPMMRFPFSGPVLLRQNVLQQGVCPMKAVGTSKATRKNK